MWGELHGEVEVPQLIAAYGAGVRSRSGYCEAKNLDVLAGTQRELEARITANAPPTVQGSFSN